MMLIMQFALVDGGGDVARRMGFRRALNVLSGPVPQSNNTRGARAALLQKTATAARPKSRPAPRECITLVTSCRLNSPVDVAGGVDRLYREHRLGGVEARLLLRQHVLAHEQRLVCHIGVCMGDGDDGWVMGGVVV